MCVIAGKPNAYLTHMMVLLTSTAAKSGNSVISVTIVRVVNKQLRLIGRHIGTSFVAATTVVF